MVPRICATVLLVVGLSGCGTQQRHPTVVIDGWWDSDYAKNACEQYKSMVGGYCDGNIIAAEIKNEFVTSFRANPACKDIILYTGFTSPDNPDEKFTNADWSLSLEPSIKDGDIDWRQSYWKILRRQDRNSYAQGNLQDMKKATALVCDNVNGVGGHVE